MAFCVAHGLFQALSVAQHNGAAQLFTGKAEPAGSCATDPEEGSGFRRGDLSAIALARVAEAAVVQKRIVFGGRKLW